MRSIYAIISVVLLAFLLVACSKKELIDQKFYYGKVQVELARLPGTPEMELKFNGEMLGQLHSEPYIVQAGSGKLAIYKAGSDTLLADTAITLGKDETRKFTFAYNEQYGIKGWVNKAPVSPDSISFQILNNLGTTHYPVASPELYILAVDYLTLEPLDTIAVIKNFSRGTMYPQRITVPVLMDQTGYPTGMYVGMLKDPATGQAIPNIGLGLDLFVITYANDNMGTFGIYVVEDDQTGFIQTNPILL